MKYQALGALASLSSLLFTGCYSPDNSTGSGAQDLGPAAPAGGVENQLKTGYITNSDGTQSEIRYEERDGFAVIEGDIIVAKLSEIETEADASKRLTPPQSKPLAVGALPTSGNANRWPNGQVPYDQSQAGSFGWDVTLAITYWNQYMPIKFVPRSGQADYVRFVQSNGCMSNVGRVGGAQQISVGSGCTSPFQFTAGAIMHEMGHAVGLWHEHQRPDRDQHVSVDASVSGDWMNYGMQYDTAYYSTPYDFASLMHYASWGAGWYHNPWSVINGHTRGLVRNNLNRPSFFDVKAIGAMYNRSKMYRYRQSRLRDYTGDGLGDLAYFEPSNNSVRILSISGSTPSTVTAQDRGVWLSGFGNASGEFQSGDFDANGKADIVFIDPSANNLRFATSNGSSFTVRSTWTLSSFGNLNGGGQYRVGDFNGDGRSDILFVDPTNNAVQVATSNGNGFNAPTTWLAASASGALTRGGRYVVGNFNTDTKADFVTYDPTTGNYSVVLSTGSAFTKAGFSSLAGWILEVDGAAELMVSNFAAESGTTRDELLVADPHCRVAAYNPDPSSNANCVYGMGNTGSSFSGNVQMVAPNMFGHNAGSYFTGRLNSSDTSDDLIFVQPGTPQTVSAQFSTGTGYSNFTQLIPDFGTWNGFYF